MDQTDSRPSSLSVCPQRETGSATAVSTLNNRALVLVVVVVMVVVAAAAVVELLFILQEQLLLEKQTMEKIVNFRR